jgi:excinuclease ABC subunit B
MSDIQAILSAIETEKNERVAELDAADDVIASHRLNKRVEYDIRMIRETGFTNGIENYSLYFDNRTPGQAPNTLFDYFPDDMLLIVDESHMTIPQFKSMPKADKSRKLSLVDHGFRLPSALDHRPLHFAEMEAIMGRQPHEKSTASMYTESDDYFRPRLGYSTADMMQGHQEFIATKYKPDAKTLFVSATPADFELELSNSIVQQIIRPTGLLDPVTYIYPKSGDYELLRTSVDKLIEKKSHLMPYMEGYDDDQVEFE